MTSLKNKFCPKPFEFFELGRDKLLGGVQSYACCPSWLPVELGNVKKNSIKEIWNNKTLQELRESIHDGSFRFCNKELCPDIAMGTLPDKEDIKDPYLKDIIENEKTVVSKGPRTLNFSNDRTCNIQCPSCRSELIVNNSGPQYEKAKEIHDRVWYECLDDLKLAIFSSTGDPFASKISRQQLLNLNGEDYPHLAIQLNTNGILLTPEMLGSLKKIHKNIKRIFISLDAASESVYNITRKGGDFKKVIANIKHLVQVKKEEGLDWHLQLDFVVQNENYFEMATFVELGLEQGVDIVYFQRIVDWRTYGLMGFSKHAVWKKNHPNYHHFLSTLENPIFRHPIVRMGNCKEFLPVRGTFAEGAS